MDNVRDEIRKKVIPYIQEFDKENRGNRLSKELVSGMAQFLEEFIVGIVEEIKSTSVGDK